MSKFVFSSPRKYVQGAGVMAQLGDYVAELGNSAFVVADEIVWKLTGEAVQASLRQYNVECHYQQFNGEASGNEISRLAALAKEADVRLVIGVGGGKRWIRSRPWPMN